MTDEKREHWAAPKLRWGDSWDDGRGNICAKPLLVFETKEAAESALRDLEAMAALRKLHALPADHRVSLYNKTWDLDGKQAWGCINHNNEKAEQLQGFGDDPADAILSALGDEP